MEENNVTGKPGLKKLVVLAIVALAIIGAALYFQNNAGLSGVMWNLSNGGKWLLPLVLVTALVDSMHPCAFSILLLTIAFLFSIGRLRGAVLRIGSVYILGIFTAYLSIGLGLMGVLHFFNTPHFMGKAGAVILIAMGVINVVNELFPAFPLKLRIPHAAHHKMAKLMEMASVPTAFMLGVLVGLCAFPCVGGPYLAVLGLLHDGSTYLAGLGYLFLYNLIFVLPLVVILFIAGDKILLDRVQVWQRERRSLMRWGGGMVMIALGLLILTL